MKAGSVVAIVIASWWLAMPVQAGGKLAKCVIRIGPERSNVEYSGDCLFFQEANGSFSISKSEGNILPTTTNVSVYVVSPGVADVRGLTVHGINSRWGEAQRSAKDPACWTGADFESAHIDTSIDRSNPRKFDPYPGCSFLKEDQVQTFNFEEQTRHGSSSLSRQT